MYLSTIILKIKINIESNNYYFIEKIITSITPGIQVNVVNSYEAAADSVRVTVLNNVLLPTDGKPIRAIRASPDLITSKPSPYKK